MLFLDKTPDLNDLEFDIYNHIMAHADSLQFMSVRDLADITHTSTASIMRFCKKFECSGFSEFKFRFKQYIESSHGALNNLTSMDEMMLINFLSNTAQPDFQSTLAKAVSALEDKELILFAGLGASKITAQYGAHYFSSLCAMSLVLEETMNYPVNHFPKAISDKLAIVVCSVSGEATIIIEFLKRYNPSQVPIISITNSSKSTIARLSHVNFPYYINQERLEYSDTTSQLPALYIIESLAKAVGLAKLKNQ